MSESDVEVLATVEPTPEEEARIVSELEHDKHRLASLLAELGNADPPEVIPLYANQLVVFAEVQRSWRANWAAKLAAEFSPHLLGVLTANKRPGGQIALIDGQHRRGAGLMIGFEGPYTVMAYHGLSVAHEAALFLALNNSRRVPAADSFRIAAISGDPSARELMRIINKFGLSLNNPGSMHAFFAIKGAISIIDEGPTAIQSLEDALEIVQTAWVDAKANKGLYQGDIVAGISLLLRVTPDASHKRLIQILRAFPGGPGALMAQVRSRHNTTGGPVPTTVRRVLSELYNKGLSSRKLPEEGSAAPAVRDN
jgi:hypothetical protein